MYNTYMLPCRQMLLCSLIIIISFVSGRSNSLSTKFNIVLKTPDKAASPTETPYKSVHVKYTLPNDQDQWTIIGFEPQIQVHQKAIEQLTVHLCHSSTYQSIWYDDKTICENFHSMLIYEWTPYSSLSPFRLSDDCGFEFNQSQYILLTVVYKKERRVHKEQSGILLYITILPIRFPMATMFVGHKQRGTHFSCRSSDFPRLIYGVKKLNFNKNDVWWRIHIIRVRQFRRKLVESVFDSESITNINENNIEIVSSDLFLMAGDYLTIECDNKSEKNCYFLIYFTYKSRLINNDNNNCQTNDFPNLFELLPPREILNRNQTITNMSNTDGLTIFLIVFILLITIWISIIIGCIIMRRIRGLVNFRPESASSLSSQKNKSSAYGVRSTNDQYNTRAGDADHVMQIDGDQGGG